MSHESDERFRLLVDGARDFAIYMLDPEGRIESWNTGAERLKGYRADEVIGRPFSIFFTPEDQDAGRPEAELRIAASEGRYEEEGWRVRRDGSRFWANIVLSSLRDPAGALRGYAKVTRDLTSRRQAEDELRQRQEQLAATLDSIGDAVIATDDRGSVTRLNPVAERLTGWTVEEALGRPLLEVFNIVNEETRRPAVNPVERVLREGIVVGLANHTALIARDGRERAIADSAAPIRGLDGVLRGSVLVFRDVTDERSLHRALLESEERFRLLVDSVRDYAIFMLDPEGRVASWNRGAARIKGYTPEEIMGKHFSLFFCDEDVRAGKPARELEIAAREGRFEEEAWRKRKDGSHFWANVIITAVHDERQRLKGFAKITRDITERRQAEETTRRLEAESAARLAAEASEAQLRASEERLRQKSQQLGIVLAAIAEGVTAQDATGRVLFANDAAARICGLPDVDALLQAPLDQFANRFELFDGGGRAFDWSRLPGRRALAGEANPEVLLRVRERATGMERWVRIRSRPVLDPERRPSLAVSIWHDVTEHQRREQATKFLGDATVVLASGLDLQESMNRLAQLAVPSLADWCAVEILEEGRLTPVSVAHIDPAKMAMAKDLRERYPTPDDAPTGAPAVARTGRAELYADIPDDLLVQSAQSEEHLRLVRQLGLRSAMVVPLTGLNRPLGALTLVSAESGRRFGPADLAFAEELGRRAGLALENARLYRAAKEAVRLRDDFLSVAGHELKTPLTAVLLKVASLQRALESVQPPPAADTAQRLARISTTATRLERLVNELLDVSRISAGRLELDRQQHDLVALVKEPGRSGEGGDRTVRGAQRPCQGADRASCPRARRGGLGPATTGPGRHEHPGQRAQVWPWSPDPHARRSRRGRPGPTVRRRRRNRNPRRRPRSDLRPLRAGRARPELWRVGPGPVDHPSDRRSPRGADSRRERARSGVDLRGSPPPSLTTVQPVIDCGAVERSRPRASRSCSDLKGFGM
jgi:PAS domain S-box-containing protein